MRGTLRPHDLAFLSKYVHDRLLHIYRTKGEAERGGWIVLPARFRFEEGWIRVYPNGKNWNQWLIDLADGSCLEVDIEQQSVLSHQERAIR